MIQIIVAILSSAVKFAMTFPLAILQFRFNFFETILWTNVGGLLGIWFFAFLSEKLITWWGRVFRKKRSGSENQGRKKKIFTRKNRRIIRIKQQYGLLGIAITTPLLLSIPVGTFLVVRYYRTSKVKFTCLVISNLGWSVIYTVFYMFWKGLLFKQG
ncbi:MAG: hypothetical protein ABFS10_03885 [Bacteroidota bacterium]